MSKSVRLKDMPDDFRPREKLIERGASALSTSELIAIFLRTGVQGRNVLEVAADLVATAGSLEALAMMDVREMAERKGIGLVKAATLAAAFELGARAVAERAGNQAMNDPLKVYEFLLPHTRWAAQEKVFVLMLDTKMNLIAWREVTKGTLTESLAHPRDILKPVLLCNAYGFIIAHNHPSGDPLPSSADWDLTREIRKAGTLMDVPMLDHVIVGKPQEEGKSSFYSFRRNKELWEKS